jgi:hypothetical protein
LSRGSGLQLVELIFLRERLSLLVWRQRKIPLLTLQQVVTVQLGLPQSLPMMRMLLLLLRMLHLQRLVREQLLAEVRPLLALLRASGHWLL